MIKEATKNTEESWKLGKKSWTTLRVSLKSINQSFSTKIKIVFLCWSTFTVCIEFGSWFLKFFSVKSILLTNVQHSNKLVWLKSNCMLFYQNIFRPRNRHLLVFTTKWFSFLFHNLFSSWLQTFQIEILKFNADGKEPIGLQWFPSNISLEMVG